MKVTFITRLALCLGVILSLSSCITDDDLNNNTPVPEIQDIAKGIIANASPNSGDLFFFADNNLVNTSALNYPDALGYFNFKTGDRVLTIKNTTGTVLATKNVSLKKGTYFTAFAVNTFDKLELVTYKDSLMYPAAGKARVRFINLSPDAAPVDIKSTSQTFATALAFKSTTEFTEVPAGTYAVTFNDNTSQKLLFTSTGLQFREGGIYTVYTKGFVAPPTGSNETFTTEVMRNY